MNSSSPNKSTTPLLSSLSTATIGLKSHPLEKNHNLKTTSESITSSSSSPHNIVSSSSPHNIAASSSSSRNAASSKFVSTITPISPLRKLEIDSPIPLIRSPHL